MKLGEGYKKTEFGLIPADWNVSTVGSEFAVQLGKMLDAEKNVGVQKPYLGNRSVKWGKIDLSDLQTMAMTRADLEKFRLRTGDLLVCEGGEVGRAAIWNSPIEECYYQKALHRLRPVRGYEPLLMLAVLRLWAERGLLSDYVTQTSIAHLPLEKFVTLPIPRPSNVEQRAITNVLSDVDALIAGLERLIAKKRDIKQAAMQQLLTGQTRLPGFSGEWNFKVLGDMAQFYKGKGLPKSALSSFGSEPCIHYGELFTQYGERIEKTISYTDYGAGTFRSVTNDVLMPTSDVTPAGLAKASCVLKDDIALGSDILVIRSNPSETSGVFLSYVIRQQEAQVLSLVTGSTVFHLYGSDMCRFKFMAPPGLDEQNAIVEVLSSMDTEVSALDTRLAKTRAIKQGMMQELLTGRTRLI